MSLWNLVHFPKISTKYWKHSYKKYKLLINYSRQRDYLSKPYIRFLVRPLSNSFSFLQNSCLKPKTMLRFQSMSHWTLLMFDIYVNNNFFLSHIFIFQWTFMSLNIFRETVKSLKPYFSCLSTRTRHWFGNHYRLF